MVSNSESPGDTEEEEQGSPTETVGEILLSVPSDSLFTINDYLEMYRIASTETAYRVLVALEEQDQLSSSELEKVTGREGNNLHYHLRKLKRSALIENRRDPNTGTSQTYSYYVLTDPGRTVLEHGIAEGIKRLAKQEIEIEEEYAT